MNVIIGEKKAFGGAAPCYKRLEDYRRYRGVTLWVKLTKKDKKINIYDIGKYTTSKKIEILIY